MIKAFVCSQLIHIMRAIQLNQRTIEFIGTADIFIHSTFIDAKKIALRLQKLKCFHRVIYIDTAEIPKRASIIKAMWGHSAMAKNFRKEKYDTLVSFNIDSYAATVLFNLNKKNDNFSYHCMEDGPCLYEISIPQKYQLFHPYRLFGIDKPFFHVKEWWFSEPEWMDVPTIHPVKRKLPFFDINDKDFCEIINEVFDYHPDPLLNCADILIMEESLFTDGRLTEKIDDFEIYNSIRKEFPNKRILVKLHPRTRYNRFSKDFQTMSDQGIPWETYLLNMLGHHTAIPIQIGIRCSTLQSDLLSFQAEGKKIFLAPMFVGKTKPNKAGIDDISLKTVAQLERIRSKYRNPERFILANNLNDVRNTLHDWLDKD